MHYEVDVNLETQLSKNKFLKVSLLFSITFTLVLVADVLFVVFSKEDYIPFLIISIVISILFAWFAIFFFSSIYGDINSRYRYFQGYESGLKSEDEVVFIAVRDTLERVNGVYVYPMYVTYVTNLDRQDKIIYTFKKELPFRKGDKLTIKTYQRILLKADLHL